MLFGRVDIYKDFASCKVISLSASLPPDTQIEEDLMGAGQWTLIEGEERTICNYKCKKALASDGALAWYTEEIPVSDGPDTYSGLPGLILKVSMPGQYTITARKVHVTANDERIDIPQRLKAISTEEYKRILRKTLPHRKR